MVRAHNLRIRNISTLVNQLSDVPARESPMSKMRYNHSVMRLPVVVECHSLARSMHGAVRLSVKITRAAESCFMVGPLVLAVRFTQK